MRILIGQRREDAVFFTISAICSAVIATGAHAFLSYLLRSADSNYINVFFNWGKLENRFIFYLIFRSIISTLYGSGFLGGITVPLAVLLGALGAIISVVNNKKNWPVLIASFALMIIPFALSVAMGTPMPARTQQTMPLAYGSLIIIAGIVFPFKRYNSIFLFTISVLVAVTHGQANTRLFLTEYHTYSRDVSMSHDIVRRLVDQGWLGDQIALVVVGTIPEWRDRFLSPAETFGASYMNWDSGGRLPIFMRHLGYNFIGASRSQRNEATAMAAEMPIWPARQSVRLNGRIAIVKIGSANR